jgi:anti-sigma factor RsiW
MTVSETMLRAYVDGELEPIDVERVEKALEASEELRVQARLMRASCLPYRVPRGVRRATAAADAGGTPATRGIVDRAGR